MSEFSNIQFKDTEVGITKLNLKENDIIIIRSETITPRMIEAFRSYCEQNKIKNNTVFLHKSMDMDKTTLENLIKQLKEKKKKKSLPNNTIKFPSPNIQSALKDTDGILKDIDDELKKGK